MRRHALGLAVASGMLVGFGFLSLRVGSLHVDTATFWAAIADYDRADVGQIVVRELRIPRTIAGALAGACFAVAGALTQGVTRNPLGAPGILGINAGASFAIVMAVFVLGITTPAGYVWFAFAGALGAAALVYAVASAGRGGATPVRLALSGAVITALLGSWTAAGAAARPRDVRSGQVLVGRVHRRPGDRGDHAAVPGHHRGPGRRVGHGTPDQRDEPRRGGGSRARIPCRARAHRSLGLRRGTGRIGRGHRRSGGVRRFGDPARRPLPRWARLPLDPALLGDPRSQPRARRRRRRPCRPCSRRSCRSASSAPPSARRSWFTWSARRGWPSCDRRSCCPVASRPGGCRRDVRRSGPRAAPEPLLRGGDGHGALGRALGPSELEGSVAERRG